MKTTNNLLPCLGLALMRSQVLPTLMAGLGLTLATPQVGPAQSATLSTTFTNPNPSSSAYFGDSVSAVGSDRVLIGAGGYNSGAGAAYLLSTSGALLTAFTN